MNNDRYLSLPLDLGSVINGNTIKSISLEDSIKQYIILILSTEQGELSNDLEFGTSIWEQDFTLSSLSNTWKDSIKESIKSSIEKYVTQLESVEITIELSDHMFTDTMVNASRIKRRLDITIKGTLIKTRSPFKTTQHLFLSPIAMI